MISYFPIRVSAGSGAYAGGNGWVKALGGDREMTDSRTKPSLRRPRIPRAYPLRAGQTVNRLAVLPSPPSSGEVIPATGHRQLAPFTQDFDALAHDNLADTVTGRRPHFRRQGTHLGACTRRGREKQLIVVTAG